MTVIEMSVIVLALIGVFFYFPMNHLRVHGRGAFHNARLDARIPLVRYFVIPYIALFPYLLFTVMVISQTALVFEFALSIAIAVWSAVLTWYLFPSRLRRLRDIGVDTFSQMIVWIYSHDHGNWSFPSSHVFYAIICSYYLVLALPAYTLAFVLIGWLIVVSTVFVKQHRVIDIFGGFIWAVVAIAITQSVI